MKGTRISLAGLAVACITLLSATCAFQRMAMAQEETSEPTNDLVFADCSLTGGGRLDNAMTVGLNAHVVAGQFDGHVTVVNSAGDVFDGVVTAISCRRDGGGGPEVPEAFNNIGDIEGNGTWNGEPGYEFAASMHDHGEGPLTDRLPDDFAITVVQGQDVTFTGGGLAMRGNIQVHPPNPAHP